MKKFEMGIGEFVQFVIRSGSIDNRLTGKSRMQQGTQIHQMIQERDEKTKDDYQKEIPVKLEYLYNDIQFIFNGRIDALYSEDGQTIIEEIKSTTEVKNKNFEEKEVHKAQLFLYGLFFLLENNLDVVNLRLHYYHIASDESSYFDFIVDKEELIEYLNELIEKWLVIGLLKSDWLALRDHSIESLDFIYDQFRKGQRDLSLAVYNSIKGNKSVFIEAPTGIGKTSATLFPAIKSLVQFNDKQIYYLTAKTTVQLEAEKTLNRMRDKGLLIKSTTITAKDKICFSEDETRNCNPDDCIYAKNFYDRLNPILEEALKSEHHYNREYIEELSRKYEVCPYQLSIELSNWSDIVICDYNYTFDPISQLQTLNQERINLIDEAHNLPDRSREMYSAELLFKNFETLKEVLEIQDEEFKTLSFLRATNRIVLFLNEFYLIHVPDFEEIHELNEEDLDQLIEQLYLFQQQAYLYLLKIQNGKIPTNPDVIKAYNEVSKSVFEILMISDYYKADPKNYRFYIKSKNEENFSIRLSCLDPSDFIHKILMGNPSILFSATLTPFSYYNQILLGDKTAPALQLESPFDQKNRLILCDNSISTRFKDREKNYALIARKIDEFVSLKKGHYLVFFPSYSFMERVLEEFKLLNKDYPLLVQTKNMNDEERKSFITKFKEETEDYLIGFSVLGGVFSEGIDLPEDQLIGTVIVGVGLPGIDYERDQIKDYFQFKLNQGFAYAYAYPGMNRVLQSAGRVIRTEKDRGIIYFIDDRFSDKFYYDMLPKHLKPDYFVQNNLQELVKSFWDLS